MHAKVGELSLSQKQGFSIAAGSAPAHITGIFEIHNSDPNLLKCGSRGIGFCVNKRVVSIVKAKFDTRTEILIHLNNKRVPGSTTKDAIGNLLGKNNAIVEVFSYSELPPTQGFGISGAGALSSAIALNSALDLNQQYDDLVNVSHVAEINNGSGLGDVIAQANGGIVFRRTQGAIGFGEVEQIPLPDAEIELVLCIMGSELHTKDIITDQGHINKINTSAKKGLNQMDELIPQNRLNFEEILKRSYEFARNTGLIGLQVANVIQKIQINNFGLASMIMLGNGIFAHGDTQKLTEICQTLGKTVICSIDTQPLKEFELEFP
jgi:pantoate kinase